LVHQLAKASFSIGRESGSESLHNTGVDVILANCSQGLKRYVGLGARTNQSTRTTRVLK
jgi:hypothetical protein